MKKPLLVLSILLLIGLTLYLIPRPPRPTWQLPPTITSELAKSARRTAVMRNPALPKVSPIDAAEKQALAQAMANACGPISFNSPDSAKQYSRRPNQRARLRQRMTVLRPHDPITNRFESLVAPYHLPRLNQIDIEKEPAGHPLLVAFFEKLVDDAIAADALFKRRKALAQEMARLSPATAEWLGITTACQALATSFQNEDKGKKSKALLKAAKQYTQVLSVLRAIRSCHRLPPGVFQEPMKVIVYHCFLALQAARQAVLVDADEAAKAFEPHLNSIHQALNRRIADLGLPPADQLEQCLTLFADVARDAAELYQLTECNREVVPRGWPSSATGLRAELNPVAAYHQNPAAGVHDPRWVEIHAQDDRLQASRLSVIELHWREPVAVPTNAGQDNTFRDIPIGLRLLAVPTELSKSKEGTIRDLIVKQPASGPQQLDLTTFNAFLDELGLPGFLHAQAATLHQKQNDVYLRIALCLPALSTQVTTTIDLDLRPPNHKLTDIIKRHSQTWTDSVLDAIQAAHQAGNRLAIQPRYPLPGLNADNFLGVSGNPSPLGYEVTIQQTALLAGFPLPVVRTFLLQGDHCRLRALHVDPVAVKRITLLHSKGNRTVPVYTKSFEAKKQQDRNFAAQAPAWSETLVREWAAQRQCFQQSFTDEERRRVTRLINHRLRSLTPQSLADQPLPTHFWSEFASQQNWDEGFSDRIALTDSLSARQVVHLLKTLPAGHNQTHQTTLTLNPLPNGVAEAALEAMVADLISVTQPGDTGTETSAVTIGTFYRERMARHNPTWWKTWRRTVLDQLAAAARLEQRLNADIDPELANAVTLRFHVPSIAEDGSLQLGIALQPSELSPVLHQTDLALYGDWTWTGTLDDTHRGRPDAAFLQQCLVVQRLVAMLKQKAETYDQIVDQKWSILMHGATVTAEDDLRAALVRNTRPRVCYKLSPTQIVLTLGNNPLACGDSNVAFALKDLKQLKKADWRPLRRCLAENRHTAIDKTLADMFRETLAAHGAITDPATLATLAALKTGTTWHQLTQPQRDALPTTITLFDVALPLTWHYRSETGFTITAHDTNGTVMGQPLHVLSGIETYTEAGRLQVRPNWPQLTTEPDLTAMVRRRLEQWLPGVTIHYLFHQQGKLLVDLGWQLPGLAIPLEAKFALDIRTLNTKALNQALTDILATGIAETLARTGRIPAIGPFQLTDIHIAPGWPAEPGPLSLDGRVTLAGITVDLSFTIDTATGTVSLALQGDLKPESQLDLFDHPSLKGLRFEALALVERLDLAKEFRLTFNGTLTADLPGRQATLVFSFVLDQQGLRFPQPVTLSMPGWLDDETLDELALGDVLIRFQPETREVDLRASISLQPGAETQKKIRLDVRGRFGLNDPVWHLRGDLFLFRARAANVRIRLNRPEQTLYVKLDSILPLDLLEFKGELIIRNGKNPNDNVLFAGLSGEVLGIPVGEAQLRLAKDGAGELACTLGLKWLNPTQLKVNYEKDFKDPHFELGIEDPFWGFPIRWLISANEREWGIGAGAKVLDQELKHQVTVPSPKYFDADTFIRDLLRFNLDFKLDLSGGRMRPLSNYQESFGQKGKSSEIGKTRQPETQHQVTATKTAGQWTCGWMVVKETYEVTKFKLFGKKVITETRTRNVNRMAPGAAPLFAALGKTNADQIESMGGWFLQQNNHALIQDEHGNLYLLVNRAGRWHNTNWTAKVPPYKGEPEAVQVTIEKHRNAKGVNLAILRWRDQLLAALSGVSLQPVNEMAIDITAASRGVQEEHPQGVLRGELLWYFGWFAHQGITPRFLPCGDFTLVVAGETLYLLFKRDDGNITLVSVAVADTAGSAFFTEAIPFKCDVLKPLQSLPLPAAGVDPPGPATLLINPTQTRALVFVRGEHPDHGPLFLLDQATATATKGTWRWLDKAVDQDLPNALGQLNSDQAIMLQVLMDQLPAKNPPLHLAFRYQQGDDDKPMRCAVTGNEQWLAFIDESFTLGTSPKLHLATKEALLDHWRDKNHQSLIAPGGKLPSMVQYGDVLLRNNWQESDFQFRADPLGPLKYLSKEPQP